MPADIMYALSKLRRRVAARLARHTPLYSRLFTGTPLTALEHAGSSGAFLAVFLPGIGDLPQEFRRQGFFHTLRAHRTDIDCVAVDLHIGHFRAGKAVSRLRADIILPALDAGYRHVFLVGVSLGGLGALLYVKEHGAEIAGVALLAPFLGEPSLTREIERAGGIGGWNPGTEPGNYARQLWRWLKDKPSSPPILLGYGERDTYARAHRLLAQVLPPLHVATVPGGHQWSAWQRLWSGALVQRASALLPPARECAP